MDQFPSEKHLASWAGLSPGNKYKQMKLFYFVMFCLFIPSAFVSAETLNRDLFETPANKILTSAKTVKHSPITRERLVHIRFQMFSNAKEALGRIYLNLFEDVSLTGILDHIERNISGDFAWIGYPDEIEGGRITLVVGDQKMAGTITLPEVIYQVREVEDGLHMIREIDASALPMTAEQSIPEGLLPEEQAVIELVNQERIIEGLRLLNCDDRLVSAARDHSEDMAHQNYFSHTSLDGRTPSQRITDAGYIWNYWGENIAAGYDTPEAVMNGWMNSTGHRANILNPNFNDIGVGYAYEGKSTYGSYWTQDFGRQPNAPVIAAFTAEPMAGGVPLEVIFTCDADDNGYIVDYTMFYGDGSASETNGTGIFTHTYYSCGTFQAFYIVKDNEGKRVISKVLSLSINEWDGDFDFDGDVDGLDLMSFVNSQTDGVVKVSELREFADYFGK